MTAEWSELRSVLPAHPALVRVRRGGSAPSWALWSEGVLRDLTKAPEPLRSLDALLTLPLDEIHALLDGALRADLPDIVAPDLELLAPVESQEVWAAGVTYRRSRDARMEEAISKDIYDRVYTAERPELFFKAAGWRVVPPGGSVGVRGDSTWDVPEPELAVLANIHGEIVAYAAGNDMSSRSIEGDNPLYLPQAKVYDRSCALGPAAVLARDVAPLDLTIRMEIERDGDRVFHGEAKVSDLVRPVPALVGALYAGYSLPVGAWLLTGTSLVPDPPYTALAGDRVSISIDGLGRLINTVQTVEISKSGTERLV